MSLPERPLGSGGGEITCVGFGVWAIGGGGWVYSWGPQDDELSLATMRHALDLRHADKSAATILMMLWASTRSGVSTINRTNPRPPQGSVSIPISVVNELGFTEAFLKAVSAVLAITGQMFGFPCLKRLFERRAPEQHAKAEVPNGRTTLISLDALDARLLRQSENRLKRWGVTGWLVGAFLWLMVLPAPGRGDDAFFAIQYPPGPATFVMRLTDPVKIHARDILAGEKSDSPHVTGTIVQAPACYSQPWSFHLDSVSISFFDLATEVCDASITYVEQHLAEVGGAFLPGNTWCPWGSKLVQEIAPPDCVASMVTSVSAASYNEIALAQESIASVRHRDGSCDRADSQVQRGHRAPRIAVLHIFDPSEFPGAGRHGFRSGPGHDHER